MKRKLTVHFPCYGFDPMRLEAHANAMSREGWQLEHFGLLTARYRRGAPNEYEYRTQVVRDAGMPRLEYLASLAQLGIESVGGRAELLLLRKRADGTPFELFSDLDSRIAQQKKARRYLRSGLLLSLFWGSAMAMNMATALMGLGVIGPKAVGQPTAPTAAVAALMLTELLLLLCCVFGGIDCAFGLRRARRTLCRLEAEHLISE